MRYVCRLLAPGMLLFMLLWIVVRQKRVTSDEDQRLGIASLLCTASIGRAPLVDLVAGRLTIPELY
jgi:hypothetical protein